MNVLANLYCCRQGCPEELHDFFDNGADPQGARFFVALAAEGEDLFHQVSCPLSGLEYLIKITPETGYPAWVLQGPIPYSP